MLVALLLVGAGTPARGVDRCKARANPKSGAIEVSAAGVAGDARWSGAPAGAGIAFADAAACVRRDKVRRCHLGAPGTLAEITPPAECRVCVHDDGESCCAFVRGCTPGLRPRDDSFAANDPRVCQGAAAADPACAPVGIWVRETGELFSDGNEVLELIELDATGAGRFVIREAPGGTLLCPRLGYVKGPGNELLLDLKDDDLLQGSERSIAIVRFARPDATSLELVDVDGTRGTFTLADAAPADLACLPLVAVRRFEGLPRPSIRSGLGFDGTSLWYTSEALQGVAVNAITGSPAAPIALPDVSPQIHALEGSDFWLLESVVSSTVARRVTAAGVGQDEVHTTILGPGSFVQVLARDPNTGELFLHGGSPEPLLLTVDATAEPDVLVDTQALPANLQGLAADGTSLWAVNGTSPNEQSVVRIDPATAAVTGSFAVPDASVDWSGIAAAGGRLYLLGETQVDVGVIVEVDAP